MTNQTGLIEWLRKNGHDDGVSACKEFPEIVEIIEQYAASLSRWIPVSERLPDSCVFVWVTVSANGKRRRSTAAWSGKWINRNFEAWPDGEAILAWQPMVLPEPWDGVLAEPMEVSE